MSRLKKEILNKLKEYGSKMGTNTMGGDDYTSKKKGGLRDFDGYDNVQYNKDMPMDEMQVVNKKTGKDITKHLLDYMEGKIDKKKFEKLTGLKKESVNEAKYYITRNLGRGQGKSLVKHYDKKKKQSTKPKEFKSYKDAQKEIDKLKRGGSMGGQMTAYIITDKKMNRLNEAKDMTLSDYIKILDKKIEDAQKAVTGKNGSKEEYSNRGDILQNFKLFRNYLSAMDKRHKGNKTKLRFISENLDNLAEACWKGYKAVGGKIKNGKQVPNCVPESISEGMFSAIDQIRQDSKNVRDFVKNVFKDREFKKMSNDKDFIKYLKSIYEGVNEAIPQNFHQGRTSDYHTALRGKNKDYSGGTNFKKNNHGQPDVEEDDEDQETNHLSNKQTHIKSPLKVAESGKKKSDKNYKDWKSTNEGFDKIEHLQLLNKALRAIPGSPKQKDIIRKLNKVRKAGGMRPLKEQSIVEYASKLTLSYIADKDSKLDGTPEDINAIDEKAERDYKDEYKKFQSSKKSKKYRAELNKYNRDKGTYGNGDGKDASHKGGKIVGFESESKNRGRAEKSRLKKESVNEGKVDRVVGHTRYKYVGDGRKGQAIVSGPMKDREKEAIIKRAKKAGYNAKPNMGGGVTIHVESLEVNEIGQFPIHNYIQGIIPTGYLDTNTPQKKKQSVKLVSDLKKTLNTFWKQHDIPYRIK